MITAVILARCIYSRLSDEIYDVIKLIIEKNKLDGNGKINYQKCKKNEISWLSYPKDGLRSMIRERKKFK